MIGITSYGAYVPLHRLSRAEIGRAWGGALAPGEKAVANFDEDSLTMAVAASRDCLKGHEPKSIDNLYFASTTFPYREKQSAAVVATALDMRGDSFTLDVSNTLRSGTNAIKLAIDGIKAKSAKNILVCASDCRLGIPNSAKEMEFGDGAAALLLGEENLIATIDGEYSAYNEMNDVWRAAEDKFVRSWEDRFVREEGFTKVTMDTVSNALKKYKLTSKDFAKLVLNAPNRGVAAGLSRSLGFDTKQVQDSLYDTAGNTGSALALMLLVAALEEAKAGDRLLWVSYGDGCDVYILTVTEKNANLKDRRGIKKHVASKRSISTYEKYLRWRDIIVAEAPARAPLDVPSAVALWRDSRGGLALCGGKCQKCGTPQYPAQRVCIECHTKDQFDDYCFADREATLTTFSHDYLASSVDSPGTICAVDFAGGGRIMCDMTDRDPQQVKVGMPVEMTFRQVRFVGGIHDYWWKCQPIRC